MAPRAYIQLVHIVEELELKETTWLSSCYSLRHISKGYYVIFVLGFLFLFFVCVCVCDVA